MLAGPRLRQDPARPGCRGHQARAAGGRPVPEGVPWPGPGLGLLRPAERGQAQREHRPQRAGCPGSGAAAVQNTADVIVENFRPGALASFGLGYESVRNVDYPYPLSSQV